MSKLYFTQFVWFSVKRLTHGAFFSWKFEFRGLSSTRWSGSEPKVAPKVFFLGHVVVFKTDCQWYSMQFTSYNITHHSSIVYLVDTRQIWMNAFHTGSTLVYLEYIKLLEVILAATRVFGVVSSIFSEMHLRPRCWPLIAPNVLPWTRGRAADQTPDATVGVTYHSRECATEIGGAGGPARLSLHRFSAHDNWVRKGKMCCDPVCYFIKDRTWAPCDCPEAFIYWGWKTFKWIRVPGRRGESCTQWNFATLNLEQYRFTVGIHPQSLSLFPFRWNCEARSMPRFNQVSFVPYFFVALMGVKVSQ